MKFTSEEMTRVRNYLTACKRCNMCKHANVSINRDTVSLVAYCNLYQKDVTGRSGYMCDSFCPKEAQL